MTSDPGILQKPGPGIPGKPKTKRQARVLPGRPRRAGPGPGGRKPGRPGGNTDRANQSAQQPGEKPGPDKPELPTTPQKVRAEATQVAQAAGNSPNRAKKDDQRPRTRDPGPATQDQRPRISDRQTRARTEKPRSVTITSYPDGPEQTPTSDPGDQGEARLERTRTTGDHAKSPGRTNQSKQQPVEKPEGETERPRRPAEAPTCDEPRSRIPAGRPATCWPAICNETRQRRARATREKPEPGKPGSRSNPVKSPGRAGRRTTQATDRSPAQTNQSYP